LIGAKRPIRKLAPYEQREARHGVDFSRVCISRSSMAVHAIPRSIVRIVTVRRRPRRSTLPSALRPGSRPGGLSGKQDRHFYLTVWLSIERTRRINVEFQSEGAVLRDFL
jgi:hypothetical protein